MVWVFVDGLGLAPAAADGSPPATPRLDALLGGPTLVDAPLAPTPAGRRFSLEATLGVAGLPGTATGQASLVTGENAARVMERHVHAYPGPQLRGFIDACGTVFSRLAQDGMRVGLVTAYPPQARETALRYAARKAGAALADSGDGVPVLRPHIGLLGAGREASDLERTATGAALLAAELARPYDLSVVETDVCDRAGHLREGREPEQRCAVFYVDAFIAALRGALEEQDVVVVASDHGNAEDIGRRGHTRNRVPVIVLGRHCPDLEGADLTAFAPWLGQVVRAAAGRS